MNDNAFREIARDYCKTYAAALHRELAELEQTNPPATPMLDRRIHREIAAMKRARLMKIGTLVAACLAIAVAIPVFLRISGSAPAASYSSAGMASSAGTSAPAAESSAAPSSSTGTSAPSEGAAPSESRPSATGQILPLSFSLPAQFTVSKVEQDYEKTVYYLEDENRDPVVMTLELSGDRSAFEQLTPVTLAGTGREAYAHSGQGYQMLCFEEQGILYTLTCRHDINTLVSFTESI